MDFKIGSVWKDKYENFSRVKITKINEDYYKKVEYEWIYCKEEKSKIGKINCLSEKAFLDIYEITDNNDIVVESFVEETEKNINKPIDTYTPPKSEEQKVNHKHKRIKTSSGKYIEIFDEVFTSSERQYHLSFIQNASYTLGKNSNNNLWQKNRTFFQAPFERNDLDELGIFSTSSFDPVRPVLSGQNSIKHSWALASTPFSTYYYHVDTFSPDSNGKTLLYYVNDRWDRNWGGETLFCDETGESEYAIQYKPGRIVVFDNSIEHRPASISMEADEFRFIFVAQFLSQDFVEGGVKHRHN